jgi:MoxR-like ATPase
MERFQLIGRTEQEDVPELLNVRAERLTHFVKPPQMLAAEYIATEPLRTAVNVALSLGRPLLLTGEPGSGKTLAAWWIARRVGIAPENMYEFYVKSDSRARDLCYEFDAVSWYRESQLKATRGEAGPVPKEGFLKPGPLGHAFGWNGRAPTKPSVILIDEIDKAPRDFPNDLLLELDQMKFTIAETGDEIQCPASVRPIIVITSS